MVDGNKKQIHVGVMLSMLASSARSWVWGQVRSSQRLSNW